MTRKNTNKTKTRTPQKKKLHFLCVFVLMGDWLKRPPEYDYDYVVRLKICLTNFFYLRLVRWNYTVKSLLSVREGKSLCSFITKTLLEELYLYNHYYGLNTLQEFLQTCFKRCILFKFYYTLIYKKVIVYENFLRFRTRFTLKVKEFSENTVIRILL